MLWAQDDADLRESVRRLLAGHCEVDAVADGPAALAAARAAPPDLVLSDALLPGLDGFGLLRELRSDPGLAMVPVILISAQADAEAGGNGGEADDYLLKPFSDRQLLARVSAQMKHSRLRREADAAARRANLELSGRLRELEEANAEIRRSQRAALNLMQDAVAAREEALQANRAKDDFLAALSHELRTPLNPVLLLASAAVDDPNLSEAARADFRTIRENVVVQAHLIDDLLDFNRIARGKLALQRARLDLHEVVRDASIAVREEFAAKDIRLDFRLGVAVPRIRGDPVRLRQVFWNLLTNAAKFTPPQGRVEISSRLRAGGTRVELNIADSGIGMSPDEIARVFQPFVQGRHADRSRSSSYGGLGIGLALCRSLVEAHDGAIRAESPGPNRGTTLFLEFPLEREGV